jgi:hypothetical protein
VAYYVPLGPRGFLLRIGTGLIGMFGGLVYWRDSRRRSISPLSLPSTPLAVLVPELDHSGREV